MSEHIVETIWRRETDAFTYDVYNRSHIWRFDSGVETPASAAPDYMGDTDRVDPEEAFVASLSSCHMLFFLAISAKRGFVVDSYDDRAVGELGKNENGEMAMLKVTLHPRIAFSGDKRPTAADIDKIHHQSHKGCFIANSVKTVVSVEPVAS